MNSPTEERWKKPNVERSWAEESWTAGVTSLRRIAMEKRRMVFLVQKRVSSSGKSEESREQRG